MILYQIDTGCLTIHKSALPEYVAHGYSGLAECKNRSWKVNGWAGPVPPGTYAIGPPSKTLAMQLEPGAFQICCEDGEKRIVLKPAALLEIARVRAMGDDLLIVIP